MKTIAILLAVLILVPVSVTYGADKAFFAGLRYDDGVMVSTGLALDLGNNLYSLDYGNAGESYGDANLELAWLPVTMKGFNVGLLAGPNVEWQNESGDGVDAVAYVLGATGALGTYEFTDDVGLWVYYKRKFALEDNQYENGTAFGGGIYVWF